MKTSIIYGLFVTSTWFVFVTSSKNFADVPELHGSNLDSHVKAAITIPRTPTNCPQCKCGIANQNNRIVNGHETKVLYYSWMCLLEYKGVFDCGCILINNRYVLTAAHCTFGRKTSEISFRFLVHDYKNLTSTPSFSRRSASNINHPQYTADKRDHDIALVKLDEPVEFNKLLRPICLPTEKKTFTGSKAVVTGWGALNELGHMPTKLQEVEVMIMSNTQCKKLKYPKENITDNMLCAGYPEGLKDSCQGDSGGPLQVFDSYTSTYQLAGVVSWGWRCARKGYPGVYSRVTRYLTWIKSNTADACYCN